MNCRAGMRLLSVSQEPEINILRPGVAPSCWGADFIYSAPTPVHNSGNLLSCRGGRFREIT